MLFALIAYFVTFFLVTKIKSNFKSKDCSFPCLRLTKTGITFSSFQEHKIKVTNVKTMQIGEVLYLKTGGKLVILSNIKDVKIYNDFIYFTCCGQTKISFDCNEFYRYFAIKIQSDQFNLDNLKQLAILDLLNNNFNISESGIAKKYLNILKNVLNIHADNEKVLIKPNRYKLSFVVIYKANNKIKQINVKQTL